MRELLLNRVAEDPNPGVRLKALDGLKAYTGDPEVRKVLAQVLMHDDNPGVRIAAVDALTAHADDNMVGFLQSVVQKEDNTYVRAPLRESFAGYECLGRNVLNMIAIRGAFF